MTRARLARYFSVGVGELNAMINEKVQNAIFVCSGCGKMILLPRAVFSVPESPLAQSQPRTVTRRKTMIGKGFQTTLSVDRDFSKWQFTSEFEDLQKEFSNFPFCSSCIEEQCKILQMKKAFLESELESLDAISSDFAKCEEFEQIVEKTKAETSVLEEVTCTSDREMSRIALHPRQFDRDRKYSLPDSPIRRATSTTFQHLKIIGIITAFKITIMRHYGCINGNRVGTKTPDIVPEDEMDNGLFFIAQLLKEYGRILELDTSAIRVGVNVTLVNENGEDPIILTTTDFKDRKGIHRFGDAMKRLMAVAARIFTCTPLAEARCTPPQEIDTKDHKIAGVSYLYEKRNPADFTKAMRNLLFAMKYIQRQAFMASIGDYS